MRDVGPEGRRRTAVERGRHPGPWVRWAPVAALLTGSCAALERGAFAPRSDIARRHLDLFTISLWVSVVVIVVTLGLLGVALWRRRSAEEEDLPPGESASRLPGTKFVAVGGLVVPTLILLAMMVVTFGFLAQVPQRGDLQVTVVGYQYWWEIRYPDHGAVTANELHIPVGTPVEVTLASNDVIHSFWVPELAGKADLVPGRETTLVIEADEPGTYRGQCAEFCGVQHANMAFLVIAEEPAAFEEWVARMAEPAAVGGTAGERAFLEHGCAACHTIRGTEATGTLGPDLTHLASRETLAAGTIPNRRGQLSGWIVDAQSVKPGNLMPPIRTLPPEDLQALLHYLEALE